MGRPRFETSEIAPDRLVTLTDGVFAIAMTILVLELAIPWISGVEGKPFPMSELGLRIAAHRPNAPSDLEHSVPNRSGILRYTDLRSQHSPVGECLGMSLEYCPFSFIRGYGYAGLSLAV